MVWSSTIVVVYECIQEVVLATMHETILRCRAQDFWETYLGRPHVSKGRHPQGNFGMTQRNWSKPFFQQFKTKRTNPMRWNIKKKIKWDCATGAATMWSANWVMSHSAPIALKGTPLEDNSIAEKGALGGFLFFQSPCRAVLPGSNKFPTPWVSQVDWRGNKQLARLPYVSKNKTWLCGF